MIDEEWPVVADRSQKKRIQNRVAQRTYRKSALLAHGR